MVKPSGGPNDVGTEKQMGLFYQVIQKILKFDL